MSVPTTRVAFNIQELGEVRLALQTHKEYLERAAALPDSRPSERAMTMVDLQQTTSALEKIRRAERNLFARLV